MLCEIYCDKFAERRGNGFSPRGRIKLKPGLNIILGETIQENSIGKSTFLLVVDFCFGGLDYVNPSINNSQRYVGDHTINFAFKFADRAVDYFGRCTATPKKVSVCDEDYHDTGKEISLDEFNEYLKRNYGTADPNDSFRNMVARYFRVAGRNNYAERLPLQYGRESRENSIAALEKLFNVYSHIAGYKEAFNDKKRRKEAREQAVNVGEMEHYAAKNASEVKENNKEIQRLRQQLSELTMAQDLDMSEQTAENMDLAAEIKTRLTLLRRKRTRLRSQLATVKANMEGGMPPTSEDFHELKEFFPDVNAAHLAEVVNFHSKMQRILTTEMSDEIDRLEILISEVESDMKRLEDNQRELGTPVNIPVKYMQEFADLQRKIDYLEAKNKGYEDTKILKAETKTSREDLEKIRQVQLDDIAARINQEMIPINDYLYEGTRYAPVISFWTTKGKDAKPDYEFKTDTDFGTANNFKGLLVYDLSILKLSVLPVLTHDSLLFNNIAPVPVERIFRTYEQINKQIFVAYDKKDDKPPIPADVLKRAQILYLYPNGGELFGWSWAKKESTTPLVTNDGTDNAELDGSNGGKA